MIGNGIFASPDSIVKAADPTLFIQGLGLFSSDHDAIVIVQ